MGNEKEGHGGNPNPEPPDHADQNHKKKNTGSANILELGNEASQSKEKENGVSDNTDITKTQQKKPRQRADSTGNTRRLRTVSDPLIPHINENLIRLNDDQTDNHDFLVKLVKIQKAQIINLTNLTRSLESRVISQETRLAPLDNLERFFSQIDERIRNLEHQAMSQNDKLDTMVHAISNLTNSEVCETPGLQRALQDLSTKVTQHTRAACTDQEEMLKKVVNAIKSSEASPPRKRTGSITYTPGNQRSQDPQPPITPIPDTLETEMFYPCNNQQSDMASTHDVPMETTTNAKEPWSQDPCPTPLINEEPQNADLASDEPMEVNPPPERRHSR